MTPRRVASAATTMISREPAITRAKTSRPSLSVPNQCVRGDALERVRSLLSNGLFVKCVPNSAATIQKSRTMRPADANVFERKQPAQGVGAVRTRRATGAGAGSGSSAARGMPGVAAHESESRMRGLSSAYSRSATIVASQ